MDMSHLLSPQAFAEFSQKCRKAHGVDHEVYDDLLAAIRATYRAEHIDGDRFKAAARRSKKLEKHAKVLVKAAKAQYDAIQALQIALTDHTAMIAGLPGQRQAKALSRAQRNAAIGEFASKSLNKTAQALTKNDSEDETAAGRSVPSSLHDFTKKRGAA
ncbi:hypothetical protein ACODT4_44670 [Streptomyces sp. 2.9]|uniref:hypothetical protein n=1 Tax=Streptomyces tritrimontium TaxID=3406573 RepID=UPI003BB6CF2B